MVFKKEIVVNQLKGNESDKLRSDVNTKDTRLEKITRAILKTIKDIDASSAGGVRADTIKKIVMEELKKDKSK
jgi:transcriptional regulator NrdR family protein